MKKVTGALSSLSIMAAMLAPTSTFASPSQTVNISAISSSLIEQGVPADFVNSLSDEFKRRLAKPDGTVDVISVETVGPKQNSGRIMPMGNIPDNQFDFTVIVVGQGTVNNRERYAVAVGGHWYSMPFWRLTDPYGVSFNKDIWRLVPGSAYYEDNYRWDTSSTFTLFDSGTSFAYTAENGAGFNADIKGDSLDPFGPVVAEQTSAATFFIEAKNTGSISGQDEVFANYYHTLGVGSIGLSFGPFSVEFSGSASTDSRGTADIFNY